MPPNWPKQVERQFELLEQADTTPWNKAIIRWFVEHYKPVSGNRKDKYLRYLREMAVLLGKSFNEMAKEDVGSFLQRLEGRFPEEWTFVDCKTMFKTFFRFYMEDIADREDRKDEYVRLAPVLKAVGKIQTGYRKHKQKKLMILTEEEVEKMLRAASNTRRELAIVTFLYHTAARPSEFVDMAVGDVEISGGGTVYFTVAGKTGTRKLPLAADETAAPTLVNWLNQHPTASDKEAPLWLNSRGEKLSRIALGNMLSRLSQRARVRRVQPKSFRKAKLSHMADDGYNAYQIKKYAGHTKIETAMFYVELSQKGFEEAIRDKYGRQEKKEALLRAKRCWKCGSTNRCFDRRCTECGSTLDMEEASRELQVRSDVIASAMPEDMLERLAELVAAKLRQDANNGGSDAAQGLVGQASAPPLRRPPRIAAASP